MPSIFYCNSFIFAEETKKFLTCSRNRNRGRTRYPKKMHLVVPMQEWYLIGRSGLSMHIDTTIKTTDGFQYFNFSQSPSYQKIQEKFVIAVESNNPENLIVSINT